MYKLRLYFGTEFDPEWEDLLEIFTEIMTDEEYERFINSPFWKGTHIVECEHIAEDEQVG